MKNLKLLDTKTAEAAGYRPLTIGYQLPQAIAMVKEARERWRKSGRTPGFEGMARMLDLAFKLKQFAAGMPSEIKEVHNLHAGKVSLEWESASQRDFKS
jgi:hypothetical protein